jgi:hypothetical protein
MRLFSKKSIMLIALAFLLFPSIASAAQPFNIEIELPDTYKTISPGGEVWFTINLLNLDNLHRLDVSLNYDITSTNGTSITHNSKTVAIETQASFVASLKMPENAPPGDYSLNLVVNSSLGESKAKAALKVANPDVQSVPYYNWVLAGVLGLVLVIFLIAKFRPAIEKLRLNMKISKIVREKIKKK